jgi:hypothetical protein
VRVAGSVLPVYLTLNDRVGLQAQLLGLALKARTRRAWLTQLTGSVKNAGMVPGPSSMPPAGGAAMGGAPPPGAVGMLPGSGAQPPPAMPRKLARCLLAKRGRHHHKAITPRRNACPNTSDPSIFTGGIKQAAMVPGPSGLPPAGGAPRVGAPPLDAAGSPREVAHNRGERCLRKLAQCLLPVRGQQLRKAIVPRQKADRRHCKKWVSRRWPKRILVRARHFHSCSSAQTPQSPGQLLRQQTQFMAKKERCARTEQGRQCCKEQQGRPLLDLRFWALSWVMFWAWQRGPEVLSQAPRAEVSTGPGRSGGMGGRFRPVRPRPHSFLQPIAWCTSGARGVHTTWDDATGESPVICRQSGVCGRKVLNGHAA